MSNIIGFVIGTLGFLFLFWKRLREDYRSDIIFSFSFLIVGFSILGLIIGLFLSNKITFLNVFNSNGLWFWSTFITGLLGFLIGTRRFKVNFFESLEGGGLGFVFWFFCLTLVNSLFLVNLKIFIFAIILGLLFGFFFYIDSRYKRFTWYKSGKIGFSGLTTLGTLFLIRAVVALIEPNMLSFVGKFDAIVSSLFSFLFFIMLYNLSGQL